MNVPPKHHWLFWDVEADALDSELHAAYVLPRVLEYGGWEDVRWVIATYGLERIHSFLRDVGHPELSVRTIHFWRALFRAEEEPWPSQSAWRKASNAPWNG